MVQKEAAERICAKETSNDFGAISAAVRYYCEPEILFHVSKGSFMPAPQVDSTVIRLNVLDTPRVTPSDEDFFFEVIKGAFSQRRKTLLNSLCSYFRLDKAKVSSLLEEIQLDPKVRPEKLTLEDFLKVSEILKEKGDFNAKN